MDSFMENRAATVAVAAGIVVLVIAGLGTSLIASILGFPFVRAAFSALGSGPVPGSASSLNDAVSGATGGLLTFADVMSLATGIGSVFAIVLGIRDLRS